MRPFVFEENRGQVDPRVQYLARGAGYEVFLTPTGASLTLRPSGPAAAGGTDREVLRLKFEGANLGAPARGREPLTSRSNYFLSSRGGADLTDIPHFAQVVYRDFYAGTDLVYQGTDEHRLRFDLVLGPGADPAAVRLRLIGATAVAFRPSQPWTPPGGPLRTLLPIGPLDELPIPPGVKAADKVRAPP